LLAGVATAADDAPLDASLIDAPEVTISSDTSAGGIYLRGDAGFAAYRSDGQPDLAAGGTTSGFDDDRFGHPVSGTLGIGYRMTDVWRADITADLFEGRFTGTDEASGTVYRADVHAIGVMANGYMDLANIAGFTPYLGAGVGATYLDWRHIRTDPGAAAGYDGRDGWRFTYALMAGASYDLTERLKLDVGYRFSDIADGDMFSGNGETGRDDGLARHEIRAGLRFSFN
jgi:opacity protein-like surface antigen